MTVPWKLKRLEGLIAAPHTPFDENGAVNLEVIEKQVALLVQHGVVGAYVSGTTGEGVSCTVAERKAVMEEWVKQAHGRLSLIIHVGASALPDAQELAAHAQRIGAHATSLVPPSFFRPSSIESLVEYVGAVASCAPRIPFYYYHTTLSGVSLSMPKFLEAAAGRVPNLAGIKFNSPDLYEYQNCLRACGGKYDIVWGVDEFLAGAQAGMATVCRIVDILVRYGGVAAGKAMMAVHGIEAGDVRLPLRALTAAEKKDVVAGLKEILGL